VDAKGNTVFVWRATDSNDQSCASPTFRIQARVRAPDGRLGPVQTIAGSAPTLCLGEPKVAVNPGGNAVFVWTQRDGTTDCGGVACTRVKTRTRAVDGSLSPIQTLSTAGRHSEAPQVGVDANGNAVFVWHSGGIVARARAANGSLSAIQIVSAPGEGGTFPKVAVGRGGSAVFAWLFDDGRTLRIQARARAANGTLSAPQVLSAPDLPAFEPQVGIDGAGNAVFAWVRYVGTTGCFDGCKRIQTRARTPGGMLSATQTLSPPGQNADFVDLAVDLRGNAVFSWTRADGTGACSSEGCRRIQARSRAADGSLSPTQTLSAPGQHASQSTVAVDPNGGADLTTADAVAVWIRKEGTADYCCYRVQAAVQIAP
jgi:hypothetical protein